MKNSTKFILIVLGVIAVIVAALTIMTRNIISDHLVISESGDEFEVVSSMDDGSRVEREYDFSDFDELKISGAWEVSLVRSDEYSVRAEFPESVMDRHRISESGGTLRLDVSHLRISGRMRPASVTVYMPELEKVDVDGAVDLNIDGFSCGRLDLGLDGAGNIVGDDCGIEDLRLESNGAVNVDFSGSEVENADVYIGGAGNIALNMAGGSLTGQLDGFANLEYSGEVSRLAVEKDGIGSISRRN